MWLKNSLFLKKSLSVIGAVSLAVFGGVTFARTQDNYHPRSYIHAEAVNQVQEYRRVQQARRLQSLNRVQDKQRLQQFQQSPAAELNFSINRAPH